MSQKGGDLLTFPNVKLKMAILEKYGTQLAFADAIKTSEVCVSRVIRGKRRLMPKQKNRWAKKLGVKADEIFPVV